MPTPNPTIPPAALPQRKIFDPWNSSATGHQRADNNLSGSTSWRQSRTLKLKQQFSGGPGGGKRMFDTVGAGSRDFGRDGRKENGGWEKGARDIGVMVTKGGEEERERREDQRRAEEAMFPETRLGVVEGGEEEGKKWRKRGVLQGLTFYINGSTAPMIGDHKLKQLIAENGGTVSIALGRRSVTHVIVGRHNGMAGGAGGGLSGSKIEKEIRRVRGCGVKFVGVEWLIQSLKAGRRLPEHQFVSISTAPCGVKSVAGYFKSQEAKSSKKTVNMDGTKVDPKG